MVPTGPRFDRGSGGSGDGTTTGEDSTTDTSESDADSNTTQPNPTTDTDTTSGAADGPPAGGPQPTPGTGSGGGGGDDGGGGDGGGTPSGPPADGPQPTPGTGSGGGGGGSEAGGPPADGPQPTPGTGSGGGSDPSGGGGSDSGTTGGSGAGGGPSDPVQDYQPGDSASNPGAGGDAGPEFDPRPDSYDDPSDAGSTPGERTAGRTRQAQREAIREEYQSRGAEFVAVGYEDGSPVVDVDWGDQPSEIEREGGPNVTQGAGAGPEVGSEQYTEGYVEAAVERGTSQEYDADQQADGSVTVEAAAADRYVNEHTVSGGQLGEDLRQAEAVREARAQQQRYVNEHTVTGGQLGEQLRRQEAEQQAEQQAEARQSSEQYGDFDWSFGLGGEGDEVEGAVEDASSYYSENVTDPLGDAVTDALSGDTPTERAVSGSGGEATGEQSLADRLPDEVESQSGILDEITDPSTVDEFGAKVAGAGVRNTAEVLNIPSYVKSGMEAAELAGYVAGGDSSERAAEVGEAGVSRSADVAQYLAKNPSEAAGAGLSIAATAAATPSAIRGLSRVSPRAGRAAAAAADPGRTAVRAARNVDVDVSSRIPDFETRDLTTGDSTARQFLRDERAQGQPPQGRRGDTDGDSESETETETSSSATTTEKVLDPEEEGVDIQQRVKEQRAKQQERRRRQQERELERDIEMLRQADDEGALDKLFEDPRARPAEQSEIPEVREGQLPPREEFPTEDAFQQELRQLREREAGSQDTTAESGREASTTTTGDMDTAAGRTAAEADATPGRPGRLAGGAAASAAVDPGLEGVAEADADTRGRFESLESEPQTDVFSGRAVESPAFEEAADAVTATDVDASADTSIEPATETAAEMETGTEFEQEFETEVEQELGSELATEMESAAESETGRETDALLFEDDRDSDGDDNPAGVFDEDLYGTGIADVDDLENRES